VATMSKCPFCGGLVDAAADQCMHCGGPLKARDAQRGGTPSAPSLCPTCKSPVASGDIVCTKCGTNLLTGQRIADERQKAGKSRGKSIGRFFTYAAAALVLLASGVLLVILAMHLMRDPVGEARRLARSGNLAEASEVLQAHLQKTPDDITARFLLGQISWQGQQYDRAAEAFEAAARQGGPRERDALILAVLASERAAQGGNRQQLLDLLSAAVQQRYSMDGELLRLKALLQGLGEDYKGQQEALREALLSGAEVPSALPGLTSALDQDWNLAEKYLNDALQENENDAKALVVRGMVHLMREQPAEAAAVLAKAGAVAPAVDGLVKLQMGILCLAQSEPGKALPLLTEARKLLPEDIRAAFFYALCLQENKLTEEAIAALEHIASGNNPYSGIAALQMAVAFMEQNNLDRAAAAARQAGESGLNTARQATIQGRIHALQNDPVKAEQAYRRAISMMADYPAAHLELGLLLVSGGSVDAGLPELEKYLELAKADPERMRANEIDVLVTQLRQARQ